MSKKREPIFYKPTKSKKVDVDLPPQGKPPSEESQIGTIQGQAPGSILEWNVSQALDILKLTYEYQYTIGGYGTLGSQRIDFLVHTPGMDTPLLVHGRYWHTGEHEDQLDTMRIKQMMYYPVRDPVVVWEEDCQTIEAAVAYLRQNLAIG